MKFFFACVIIFMLRKNSTMNSNFARPMNWLNRLQWISINTQSFLFRILEITKDGCIIMCLFATYLTGIVITFWQVLFFLYILRTKAQMTSKILMLKCRRKYWVRQTMGNKNRTKYYANTITYLCSPYYVHTWEEKA